MKRGAFVKRTHDGVSHVPFFAFHDSNDATYEESGNKAGNSRILSM